MAKEEKITTKKLFEDAQETVSALKGLVEELENKKTRDKKAG